MVTIYCIEDINDLRYVGSTTQKLKRRLTGHRCQKTCSSSKLNLHNCIIFPLETCEESNRSEREKYWINKLDCVNTNKLNFDKNEYNKKYANKRKQYDKEYYQKRKIKIF